MQNEGKQSGVNGSTFWLMAAPHRVMVPDIDAWAQVSAAPPADGIHLSREDHRP